MRDGTASRDAVSVTCYCPFAHARVAEGDGGVLQSLEAKRQPGQKPCCLPHNRAAAGVHGATERSTGQTTLG